MKQLTPIFTIFALLSTMMAPVIVLWHNSGTQPQPYNLTVAAGTAIVGCVCIMLLFFTILRGK
jgi:hypothetical protein